MSDSVFGWDLAIASLLCSPCLMDLGISGDRGPSVLSLPLTGQWFHCPVLPWSPSHSETLAPPPSLATFCFLLVVTLTPLDSRGVGGDAGSWVK